MIGPQPSPCSRTSRGLSREGKLNGRIVEHGPFVREGDDAIRKLDCLHHVVCDEQHGLFGRVPHHLEFLAQ